MELGTDEGCVCLDKLQQQTVDRRHDCGWLGQGAWGAGLRVPNRRIACQGEMDHRWLWEHLHLGLPGLRVQASEIFLPDDQGSPGCLEFKPHSESRASLNETLPLHVYSQGVMHFLVD